MQVKNLYGEIPTPASGYYQIVRKIFENLDEELYCPSYFKAFRLSYWGGKDPEGLINNDDEWRVSNHVLFSTQKAAHDLVADVQNAFQALREEKLPHLEKVKMSQEAFKVALTYEKTINDHNWCPSEMEEQIFTSANYNEVQESIEDLIENAMHEWSEENFMMVAHARYKLVGALSLKEIDRVRTPDSAAAAMPRVGSLVFIEEPLNN